MKVLMILLSGGGTSPNKDVPAVHSEWALGFYYAMLDAAADVTLASPSGGYPPMDFGHRTADKTTAMARFERDRKARDDFNDTVRLDQVCADDFDAAVCIGLPKSVWGSSETISARGLIDNFLDAGKPVAVMPSGPDLTPKAIGSRLLIGSDGPTEPTTVAKALIRSALRSRSCPNKHRCGS